MSAILITVTLYLLVIHTTVKIKRFISFRCLTASLVNYAYCNMILYGSNVWICFLMSPLVLESDDNDADYSRANYEEEKSIAYLSAMLQELKSSLKEVRAMRAAKLGLKYSEENEVSNSMFN